MAKNKKTVKKANPQDTDISVSAVQESKPEESKAKKPKVKSHKAKDFFKGIGAFFKDCKNEIKKIVWPTVSATFKNMGIVLVIIVIIGLFVFGLDTAFISLLSNVMNVAA